MQSILRFALFGLAQGAILWWLHDASDQVYWPAIQPILFNALLYAVLALPLFYYLTQDIETLSPRLRQMLLGLITLLFASLGAMMAWITHPVGVKEAGDAGTSILGSLVLGFTLLGLLCGFDYPQRRWRYPLLFHYAWRNGILLATAGALLGVVWMVLFAGAKLMSLIGLTWVMTLIKKPLFIYMVSSLVVALAIAIGLLRANMTDTLRRFVLSIASWLLPLVLVFALLWVLSLPFTGLDLLFKTRNAAFILLWFMVLAVLFANSAYQDGRVAPYRPWLAYLTQLAWLTMPVLVIITWWALGQRIAQHGLSEQRIWAILITTLATLYSVGYATSWYRRRGWLYTMGTTNIIAALVLSAALLALTTPLTHIKRLGVAAHLHHVAQGGSNEEPDWDYLRWYSARYGIEALQAMARGEGVPAGKNWAEQASRELKKSGRYENAEQVVKSVADLPRYPAQRPLPEGFAHYADDRWGIRRCLTKERTCVLWVGELNGVAPEEVIMMYKYSRWAAVLYSKRGDDWSEYAMDADTFRGDFNPQSLEQARPAPSRWQDLQIGKRRLSILPGD